MEFAINLILLSDKNVFTMIKLKSSLFSFFLRVWEINLIGMCLCPKNTYLEAIHHFYTYK